MTPTERLEHLVKLTMEAWDKTVGLYAIHKCETVVAGVSDDGGLPEWVQAVEDLAHNFRGAL